MPIQKNKQLEPVHFEIVISVDLNKLNVAELSQLYTTCLRTCDPPSFSVLSDFMLKSLVGFAFSLSK